MRFPLSCLARALGVAGVLAASQARALPAATTGTHCGVGSIAVDDPSGCALGGRLEDNAFGSLTLAPFVGLTAEANTVGAPGIHGAGATAFVNYSFQVTGGTPGDIVPILVLASLSASGSDPTLGYGFASLRVQTGIGTASVVFVCNAATCPADSFSGALGASARSGEAGDSLQLQVEASVVGTLAAQFAHASIDPFITVDPSFPNASLYAIEVSPGVANVLAPEPARAALAGLGALFCASARRCGSRRARKRGRARRRARAGVPGLLQLEVDVDSGRANYRRIVSG